MPKDDLCNFINLLCKIGPSVSEVEQQVSDWRKEVTSHRRAILWSAPRCGEGYADDQSSHDLGKRFRLPRFCCRVEDQLGYFPLAVDFMRQPQEKIDLTNTRGEELPLQRLRIVCATRRRLIELPQSARWQGCDICRHITLRREE